MNRFFKSARTAFLAGVILLAPLSITLLVFSWLVENIGGRFRSYFFFYLPNTLLDRANLVLLWNVLATVLVLILVTLLGYLSRYFIGRSIILIAERIVRTVPFVNSVYTTVKQIADTFSLQKRAVFQKVVLVEFPRSGSFALGFLTNRAKGEIQERTNEELLCVFLPTTPNPTSGFLLMFSANEVTELDMSVAEGMKVIISGGALVPSWDPELGRTVVAPVSIPNEPTPHRAPGSSGEEEPNPEAPPST
jgi:uncharacterized membrane protein